MTQKIDVEDLTLVMTALNSARVLLEEIHEDFWDALDPSQEAGLISVYFPHNRAKSNAVDRLLYDIEKELQALWASTGYRDQTAEDKRKGA